MAIIIESSRRDLKFHWKSLTLKITYKYALVPLPSCSKLWEYPEQELFFYCAPTMKFNFLKPIRMTGYFVWRIILNSALENIF